VPKIPPKIRAAPRALPADLAAAGSAPHLALERPQGRLWLADCLDFLAALPDGSVRLVFADPPYGVAKAEWDEFPSLAAYVDWCDRWLAEIARVLADDGTAYVCGFSEMLAEIKARSARRFAGGVRWLVWSYRNKANLGSDWGRSHESLLHLRNGRSMVMNLDAVRVPYNAHTTRYPTRVQAVSSQYGQGTRRDRWEPHPLGAKPRDVLDIPTLCNGMAEKTDHPTQKPEELLERLIAASSNPGDLVVDPFAGSGTTLVVAERLGRRWHGAERDPRYVALARERITSGSPGRSSGAPAWRPVRGPRRADRDRP
jgi:site-specific DNA-methyltransferase (adenine-specific)